MEFPGHAELSESFALAINRGLRFGYLCTGLWKGLWKG